MGAGLPIDLKCCSPHVSNRGLPRPGPRFPMKGGSNTKNRKTSHRQMIIEGCVPIFSVRRRRDEASIEEGALTIAFDAAFDGKQIVGTRFRSASPRPSQSKENAMHPSFLMKCENNGEWKAPNASPATMKRRRGRHCQMPSSRLATLIDGARDLERKFLQVHPECLSGSLESFLVHLE